MRLNHSRYVSPPDDLAAIAAQQDRLQPGPHPRPFSDCL